MTLTERERIEHLKKVLLHYATQEDYKNIGTVNEFKAIQAIQKMAGHSSEKDYVMALADGLKYGNWPWVNVSEKRIEDSLDGMGI